MTTRTGSRAALWATLGVCVIAFNLRPGATSVGPVLEEARTALGMGGVEASLLIALPGLVFAVFGALAVATARLVGLVGGLALSAVLIAAGLGTRILAVEPTGFLLLSVVALAGAGVGNVLVPVFVKTAPPRRQTPLLTFYTVCLAAGSAAPGLLSRRIIDAGLGDWRTSLGLWGAVAGVAALGWVFAAGRQRGRVGPARHRAGVGLRHLFRSRRAVALAVFFGLQSAQAYVLFGVLPQILRDKGVPALEASDLAAFLAIWGLPAGLVVPPLAARLKDVRPLVWIFAGLYGCGYLGLLLAGAAAPWLWVGCLGAAGAAFPLALALVPGRTRDLDVTAALSGFSQSAGYLCAAAGPFLIGLLNAWTGGWTAPLLVLIASMAVFVWAGGIIGRPGLVDAELGPSAGRPALGAGPAEDEAASADAALDETAIGEADSDAAGDGPAAGPSSGSGA
ncbi:MAG: MFS transporter [Propionibacteriaceae bacterium]|jgi:CP family cyanate transporter-like MFS transporter|nr:MFS transporter [Propionibacteriaceae bacterium]